VILFRNKADGILQEFEYFCKESLAMTLKSALMHFVNSESRKGSICYIISIVLKCILRSIIYSESDQENNYLSRL